VAESVGKGVSEKLRRAHMHRQDLERRVDRFVNTNAYSFVRHDDIETGKRLYIAQVHKRPPLVRWGALIGECLFNFRSALDHVAYDLAVAYSGSPLPAEVARKSEFPIFYRSAPTKERLDAMIGAVHPKARDLIEQMQPYGGNDRAALKYLETLQNFDKHRTLHLVAGVSTGVSIWGEYNFEYLNFRPFEHGDVLARLPLAGDPERDQEPDFTFGIAFSDVAPGSGEPPDVAQTLRWIGEHIKWRVLTPLLPFL
jgi:hypothetical protein